MIFNRHERCVGLTLFRLGQWNVEVWLCPKGYEIKPHSHPNEHVELMYLFGKTTFCRKKENTMFEESFKPKWYHVGRRFTIKPGMVHWFKVSTLPLVFINFARFTKGHKPTSAATDFKLYA